MKQILPWLLCLWIFPWICQAHVLKLSDSELRLQGKQALWDIRVHLGDFDVKFGQATEAEVKAYFPQRLGVSVQGKACGLQTIEFQKVPAQDLAALKLSYLCPSEAGPLGIHYDLFYGDPNHRHLMKVAAGSQSSNFTFDPGHTEFELAGETRSAAMVSFFKLGLEHILIGYDHILFVLALIFGARRFKDLIWLVTSFTLAHSITLALATLEIITLPPKIVEPAIAASIVLLSLIDFFPGKPIRRVMVVVTFLFGLVHGLGFSYILQEAHLEAGSLVIPLVFFNLGVEIGQLLIIALIYPLTLGLKWLAGEAYRYVQALFLLAIAGMGLYWFLERVLS
ncbi:MAG TPA: HupE/UreJ family protein [bacterium]|nr:HupE/UreJ family protein [bacterium]